MYLKEIKASGFKSFADTIDIELTNIANGTICAVAIIKKIVAVAIKASYEIPVRIV